MRAIAAQVVPAGVVDRRQAADPAQSTIAGRAEHSVGGQDGRLPISAGGGTRMGAMPDDRALESAPPMLTVSHRGEGVA